MPNAAGMAAVLLLIAAIVLGSDGLRHYDLALLPYTCGVVDGRNEPERVDSLGADDGRICHDRELIARMAVRHEQLRVIKRCLFTLNAAVRERFQEGDQRQLLLPGQAEAVDVGIQVGGDTGTVANAIASPVVERDDLPQGRLPAVVEIGPGQRRIPERGRLEGPRCTA